MTELGDAEQFQPVPNRYRRLFGEYVSRRLKDHQIGDVAHSCGRTLEWFERFLDGEEIPSIEDLTRISILTNDVIFVTMWRALQGPRADEVADRLRATINNAVISSHDQEDLTAPAEAGGIFETVIGLLSDVNVACALFGALYSFVALGAIVCMRLGAYGQDNVGLFLSIIGVAWVALNFMCDRLHKTLLRKLRRRIGLARDYQQVERVMELKTGLSGHDRDFWSNSRALIANKKLRYQFSWSMTKAEIGERIIEWSIVALPVNVALVQFGPGGLWWLSPGIIAFLTALGFLTAKAELANAVRLYESAPIEVY